MAEISRPRRSTRLIHERGRREAEHSTPNRYFKTGVPMAKWADYGIYAVRFNVRRTHIDRVRAMPDNGESFGSSVEMARTDVISAIKREVTFVTIIKGTDDKWKLGSKVFIVIINGTEYIKTVNDNTAQDNLDNLPEF
jgi:hypothetical protein